MISAPVIEQVLCTPTAALPASWLPPCGAIALDGSALFAALEGVAPVWLPRPIAESDATHKQWIPYGLIQEPSGRWACYRRRGTEFRLHGARSLGIGGHINPVDAPSGTHLRHPWHALLWNGFLRELAEELPTALPGRTRLLGLIHESTSEVGRVHLGAVFLHKTDTPIPMDSGELHPLEWLTREELNSEDTSDIELWSKLALQLVPTALP